MNGYRRYGLYVVPQGALFDMGSAWLGWDSAAGDAVAQPSVPAMPVPVADVTATPRKYGLHGTIKPPFRLADGQKAEALAAAAQAFCAARPPVTLPVLTLRRLGRFLALVPETPVPALTDLAAATVEGFEPFRAPLNEAELAKRRKSRLTARQEALLIRWGYPYVMDAFRFHITLTGPLPDTVISAVEAATAAHFAAIIGQPLQIADLALMGEDETGRFHLLHRYALTG